MISAGRYRHGLNRLQTSRQDYLRWRGQYSPLSTFLANGLKKGDYDTLPTGVAAARFAALQAGVVDAAIVLPPLNFQAAAAGLADGPHPLPHFRYIANFTVCWTGKSPNFSP